VIRLPQKVLCLDWDKRSLRIVLARVRGGKMELEDAHAHRIGSNVDVSDPKSMGPFIAQMLHRHRIKSNKVIVDVTRDKAVINRLTLAPTPDNETPAAVRFQAMRELPFPLSEAVIDFVVLERDDEQRVIEVLLAAVRTETLAQLRETCEAAGLTPVRIGLRPYANMVAVHQLPAMLDQRVLLLDVGPSMTEIDILRGEALSFSRAANVSVPFFAGELVSDESRVTARGDVAAPALADSVESDAVSELLVEVTRTLQAYRATEPDAPIEQIVIGGGTGVERALLEALDERFGLPTTLYDPTPTLGVDEQEASKLRSFSAVLGLAWALRKDGLLELDFLNPKKPIPARQTLKQRIRIAGVVGATVAIGLVSVAAANYIKVSRELGALERSNDTKAVRAKALGEIEIKTQEASDWTRESRMLVWLDHLLDLTESATAPGKELLVTDVSFNAAAARWQITMKVICTGTAPVESLIDRLNELRVDGKRVYKVDPKVRLTPTNDTKFTYKTDVQIELVDYTAFISKAARKQRAA